MKFRKLRFAWSVAWGVVCLLLIALWVRSYSWWDYATIAIRPAGAGIGFQSAPGRLLTFHAKADSFPDIGSVYLKSQTGAAGWWGVESIGSFYFQHSPLQTIVVIPHWFALLCTGFIAAASWLIRWRYSLRTLLIGMTVAAIGLGWLVYALK